MLVAKQTEFGDRLRAIREGAGLSQYKLAQVSGVSAQAISRIEAGLREPGWATVLRLARALGVSVERFDAGEQFEGLEAAEAEPPPAPKPKKK